MESAQRWEASALINGQDRIITDKDMKEPGSESKNKCRSSVPAVNV